MREALKRSKLTYATKSTQLYHKNTDTRKPKSEGKHPNGKKQQFFNFQAYPKKIYASKFSTQLPTIFFFQFSKLKQ